MADFDMDNILAQVDSEVGALTPEQLKAELLKVRVRQKTQMKKNQGSGAQKAYQTKQREKIKLLKEKAKELGLWDEIEAEADEAAEAKLAEESVDTE